VKPDGLLTSVFHYQDISMKQMVLYFLVAEIRAGRTNLSNYSSILLVLHLTINAMISFEADLTKIHMRWCGK
jgi:hypothetical protein